MENHLLHCSFPCFAKPSGLSSIKHNIMQRKLKKIQSCITIQRAFKSILFRKQINSLIKHKKVSAIIIQNTYVKYRNNEEEIFNIKNRKKIKNKSKSRIIQNKYKKCLVKRRRLREVCALKIQVLYRIYNARKFINNIINAIKFQNTIKIQNVFRSYKAKQILNNHINAVKIQNAFRSYKAKKILHILKRTNIINNVKISFYNSLEKYIKKRSLSAVLIQNTFKNYIHNKKEKGALKIQRCYNKYLIEMDDLVII